MKDIVERLREPDSTYVEPLICEEAAAMIEQLREMVAFEFVRGIDLGIQKGMEMKAQLKREKE
jgi:hypothetical protein